MKKTMVYLTSEQHRRLKRQAEAEGQSMAELIREAVDKYVAPPEPDYYGFVGIGAGPSDGKTSETVKEELKKALKSR